MAIKRSKLIPLLAVLAVGWSALFYSDRGLLVWQWTDVDASRLSCWYLTAAGPTQRSHLHTTIGLIGRSACPRTIELGR